ncbi:histidine phosphatase family protein [Histidinibacterium lentulum]|uniref:Histidine phosphatase family protein n=1 Tax=Histidinibacterium lentulum TaxID=2480588 RepID=A0A3N2R0N5_9RHOB|nr:histidine phosphatase family protein [Histidinibacterium lentulum]ROU01032.1 histidine phosphatase family protein [Histidinibacterium lentulum]
MTRWFWVRHGPTHQTTMTGHRDVAADLTDLAALAGLDAALPAEALVISSDLLRARSTADALAGARNRLPHEPQFREFDFGAWDGLHHAAVTERDPDLSARFWEEPGALRAPGGESWNDVAARVTAAADRLTSAHPGAAIVAVAHLGPILTQLHRARGGRVYDILAQRIEPLSLTELVIEDGRVTELSANRIP